MTSYFYSTKILNKCLTLKKHKKCKSLINMYLNSTLEFNLLQKCNFLTTTERLIYYSLLQMYKFQNSDNGPIFSSVFLFDCKKTITRNTKNLTIVRHNSEAFKRSLNYRLIKLWNELPLEIRDKKLSLSKFKYEVFQCLVNKRNEKFCYE